jgi:hypothetical protein
MSDAIDIDDIISGLPENITADDAQTAIDLPVLSAGEPVDPVVDPVVDPEPKAEDSTLADAWKDVAEKATELLKLQAAPAHPAGGQETDEAKADAPAEPPVEEEPSISFGDMSEEEIAKGIREFLSKTTQSLEKRIEEKLKTAVEPIQQVVQSREVADAQKAHYGAILEKHPDALDVARSAEFDAWMKQQPGFARAAIQNVLERGKATEIIEVLDTFKAGIQKVSGNKVADAIGAVRNSPPASLTDIPGGKAGATDVFAGIDGLSPELQVEALAKLSPEQQERWLNRAI